MKLKFAFQILFLILLIKSTRAYQTAQESTATTTLNDDKRNEEFYGDQPTSYFEHNSLSDKFNRKLTFEQYLSYSQRALNLIAGFDSDLHRYDSANDLINSFERNLSYRMDLSQMRAHIDKSEKHLLENQNELTLIENEQNQNKCGHQLANLIDRLQILMTNYSTYTNSKELELLNLIDSFGSPESELLMGNSAWLGSYRQCLEAKSSRYCIASFRPPSRLVDTNNNADDRKISLKMAVCLPNSCNSLSILRHSERIETLAKLVRLNRIIPFSEYKLSHLYCLPDDNSPLRQFSLSAKLFIITLSAWLTIVFYFSLKYELIRMSQWESNATQRTKLSKLMRSLAFRLSCEDLFGNSSSQKREPQVAKSSDRHSQVTSFQATSKPKTNQSKYHSVKARNVIESLEQSAAGHHQLLTSATAAAAANGKRQSNHAEAPIVCCIVSSSGQQPTASISQEHGETPFVQSDSIQTNSMQMESPKHSSHDLSIMDGIKVISMIWLISAHTLLFFIRTIANGREFWSILRDARFMTVMAGIFPVDTFFTITGILTAYLKFNKQDPIESPKYWLEALMHRYLRFMPMYLIVFWFTRDVSEYIGSGPLWDYSTANTSLRSVCKQESISVALLFQANFKPLDQHCVKPAWYLANDYQFLLITPLFMMLFRKSKLLGYWMVVLSIIFSLVAQFLTVFYSNDMDDIGVLVNFKPMFATYVLKNLWKLYVLPYNRIPPYLIGILTGHLMYMNTTNQLKPDDQKKEDSERRNRISSFQSRDSLNSSTTNESLQEQAHKKSTIKILDNGRSSSYGFVQNLSDYLCIKVWTPLVFLISIIYLPMLTKLVTQVGLSAKIGTSSIIALMRFVWSLAIARLIYIATTRHLENNPKKRANCFIVRFLASPMWKPWSKIGLSALLIQWEVIGYLAQIQTCVPDMSITFLLANMLACIVVTYLLAILIYLTIEYPLSQFEQLYILPALFLRKS